MVSSNLPFVVTNRAGAGLAALGDGTRRAIFECLSEHPRAVGELADVLPVSRPAVSQHLKVLRETGFATVRPEGTRRLYAVDSSPLREVDAWLAPYRALWSERLDALERHLDDMSD